MALEEAVREFQRGILDNKNRDKTECTASNFMPKDLIEIICILKRDEKCHSYKKYTKEEVFYSCHQVSRQEWRIDAIEEQRFRSTNSFSSGQERSFFKKSCLIESVERNKSSTLQHTSCKIHRRLPVHRSLWSDSQRYAVALTYICCFLAIPAARYTDGSQSMGPCGQPARELWLLATYICCFSVIQSFNH